MTAVVDPGTPALGSRSRLVGGALLLGWTVTQILGLWAWATDAWIFSGWESALNWLAFLLLLATLVLTVRYARGAAD